MNSLLARLLGYGPGETIRDLELSPAAAWAQEFPLLVLAGCLVLAAVGVGFYTLRQPVKSRGLSYVFAIVRAALLCIILLLMAEPTLEVRVSSHPKPWLWLLFDGSASMAIEDVDAAAVESAATAITADQPSEKAGERSRIDKVRQLLRKSDGEDGADRNLVERLSRDFRVRAFIFDRPGEVRPLVERDGENEKDEIDPRALADQLTADGQVTALGDAFNDLRERYAAQRPAGVVVFSDFNKNAGLAPVETATRLGVPLYCVGVGPASAVDTAVELQGALLMKKGEQSELRVTVRREGGAVRDVTVRLKAERIGTSRPPILIGERTVTGTESVVELPFPYTPDEVGRFEFTAEADPQPGETILENNRAQREVNVRDDFLHLTFVDYEPNWEWRFIKEVFHRDRLVGMRGFRTFLRSADPKVRQTNELFLPSLTPPRGEFFVNDVIFLGDMPATSLSTRYCEMLKEFVDKFGGGLVIVSGPNFGPGELSSTPLADLLPVRVIPGGELADSGDKPFAPRLTDEANRVDFMQLSADPLENRSLWSRLGPLTWYQPVAGVHDKAQVLLEHPTAKCNDGRTPQPLIAVRTYGKGEVVYLAMNETWRLRREYGETYYRKFWGQMIHRLGLRHALGDQKRFVVRTDRRQYQSGERVTVSVEAYDQNYEPLTTAKLAQSQLIGELILPIGAAGGAVDPATGTAAAPRKSLRLSQFREGEFQTEFDVQEPGEYVVRVADPLSKEQTDESFRVANLSAERRSAVRDTALEAQLAALESPRFSVAGRRYELSDVDRLPDEVYLPDEVETYTERLPLWNSWPAFLLVVMLMLFEWFLRKWLHLP